MKKTVKFVISAVIIAAMIVLGITCMVKPKPTSEDALPASETGNLTNDGKIADRKNATAPEKFKYEFNPHVISKEYITIYGADIEKTFYDFCDAVLNGESTFQCASEEVLNTVISMSRVCLPIANEYVDKENVYVENGVGHLSYTIKKEELQEKVKAFKDKVTDVITSAIPYEEDDFILAMELLTAVANKDIYDEAGSSIENALKWQPYRSIMEDEGICQEIAGEYIYYLLQVGINATTCDGMEKNQEYAHVWAVVELDGEHYHVDPTFTIQYKDGLAFFCIDDEMREQYGNFDMEDLRFADSSSIHYQMDSKKYKDLWGAEHYTLDHENRIINMTVFYSGEKKEYSYDRF